jgi:CheY-like chemotaxis protein
MGRILVAEDDPDILSLVEYRLGAAGHQVIGVASGPEALEVVERRGAPELVVLDVAMPEMDGLELLAELRRRPGLEQLPAIFLSARVLPGDIEAGRALGATYLTKPFVASALLGAVDKLLPATTPGW